MQCPAILSAAPSCNEYLQSGANSKSHEGSIEAEEISFVSTMNEHSINYYLSEARNSLQRKSYYGILEYVEPILSYDNKHIQALFLYARANMGLGNYAKALKAQAKAMKLVGHYSGSSYVTYSQLLIYLGRPLDAEKFLDVVLKKDPNSPSANGLIAQVYLHTGRLIQARDIIMAKIDTEPGNPRNLILLYEYYYRAHFFADAYKIANSLVEQNKPKKDQVRVPREYRKGLALRAKVVAKMNRDLGQAWRDIELFDTYNNTPANWVGILKAEIQFKMGRADKSRSILLELAAKMKEVDLLVVASLIYLENQGQSVSLSDAINNPLLDYIVKGLSNKELVEVTRLLKNFSWDYQDDGTGELRSDISNSFWIGDAIMQPRNADVNNASRKLPPEFY